MTLKNIVLLPVVAFILSPFMTARAEITDSSFYGFTVKHEYVVKANPDSLYKYIYRDVSLWWSPLHTFSGNAANLIMQPKANGCFCEKLADGGSVRHMTVIYTEPGKVLRLEGALGPLQEMAVNGVLTLEVKSEGEGSLLKFSYTVGGYSATSIAKLAPIVDRVLVEQFDGLKRFAEAK